MNVDTTRIFIYRDILKSLLKSEKMISKKRATQFAMLTKPNNERKNFAGKECDKESSLNASINDHTQAMVANPNQ